MTEAEDVLRAFFEDLWGARDLSRFGEFVSKDVKFHRPSGEVADFDGWRKSATGLLTGLPDIRMEVEATASAGDVAAARIWMIGTHRGELHGHAPTGRAMRVQGRPWARVRDGRIVEFWSLFDELGMLRQLGLLGDAGRVF